MKYTKACISGYKPDDISYCGNFMILDKLPEGHAKQVRLAPGQKTTDVYGYDFYEVDVTDEEGDSYIRFFAVKKENEWAKQKENRDGNNR